MLLLSAWQQGMERALLAAAEALGWKGLLSILPWG